MASFLAARLKKLERQRFKPKVRRNITEFDPVTGRTIGTAPASRRVMRVPAWGSNEQWAEALLKQQHLLQRGIGK